MREAVGLRDDRLLSVALSRKQTGCENMNTQPQPFGHGGAPASMPHRRRRRFRLGDDLPIVAVQDRARARGGDLADEGAALAEQRGQRERVRDHVARVVGEPADAVVAPSVARVEP